MPEGLSGHALAAPRDKQRIGIAPLEERAASLLQVLVQPVHRLLAKRDQALLRTLAEHAHHAGLEIGLEDLQRHQLGHP